MTCFEWRRTAEALLSAAGDEDAALDAKLLLCAGTGIELSRVLFENAAPLNEEALARLKELLKERCRRTPMQYIEQRAYFMGLEFYVDGRVLIPRQDTEILAEAALERMKPGNSVLDLCTGSGALAVTLAKFGKNAEVTASDISPEALEVAQLNAERNSVGIETVLGDGFEPLAGRQFDIIVCNPPYLTDSDMEELQPEVRREPELALRGGPDGLTLYRRFARELPDFLKPGGTALFEVGIGQANAVRELLRFGETGIIKDLCGVDRVVYVRKNNG